MQVIPAADLTKAADCTQDSLDFLLALLAACAPASVRLLGSAMPSFKLAFYKQTARQLAESEPVVAALVATGRERQGVFTGKMEAVARASGLAPDLVQHALQRLAAAGQVHLEAAREQAVALALRPRPAALPALSRIVHTRLARLQLQMVRLAFQEGRTSGRL